MMETIIIVLDSKKMTNPDLDIRYTLPDRIEEYTNHQIRDNGYDYLSDTELGLWLETDHSTKKCRNDYSIDKKGKFFG